ncbi:tandem-95 repeat protein [Gilvimarinus agarilyticus]|uniref:tandem-95 repeat protein n=1 Tax=Gilvimarinus agarilyticus TaxID=679259 RepID=UPI0005A28659|nr:tandem-95 repeat protein [Gilvimarinus agarilyticus]
MTNKMLTGLTSLLLPFAAYGAPASYANYQRKALPATISEQVLTTPDALFQTPPLAPDYDGDTLSITQGTLVTELVVIDAAVPDKHVLYQGLKPGLAVVEINSQESGVEQLKAVLAQYKNLAAVHIVSHATEGELLLGNSRISAETIKSDVTLSAAFKRSVQKGGDLLFYGCDLADQKAGEAFIDIVHSTTGLDVAASDDKSGRESLNGDWDLEIARGDINTKLAFSDKALTDFSSVLAPVGTKTFEGVTNQVYAVNAEMTFPADEFAAFIKSTQPEIINGTNAGACIDDLYVNLYYSDSSFYIRSEPGGDSFGMDQLVLRQSNSYNTTEVDVYGFDSLASTTPIASKKGISLPAAQAATNVDLSVTTSGSFANIKKLQIVPIDDKAFCINSLTFSTPSDVTPPVFNSTPSVASETTTGATLSADLDEDGTVYYVVVPNGAGAPSASQVSAGQNSSGGAPSAVGNFTTTATTGSEAFSGLVDGTAYDLYVVAQDTSGNLQNSAVKVDFTTEVAVDSNGNLTAAGSVTEPVGLNTTVDTVGEAVDVLDFTLTDGSGGDGLTMTVSEIRVNVSGTSTDAERAKVTWRLNGNDATDVTGTYNPGSDTITFAGLPISVAHGASETYTINAYYNDNTGLVDGHTIILSLDGDADVTVGGAGTQMGTTSPVTNGTGSSIDVIASELVFSTQPAGSVSGAALSTQPVVTAQDAFGNTDTGFTETITLTESSNGALTSNAVAAVSGVATFTNVTYSATADQQSFTLTADDQGGVGTDLPMVGANAVTSDVVATRLVFATNPAPLTVTSGAVTAFTTVPVVRAVDHNSIVDTGYSTGITLAEVNGAGSATMSGTGDTDGSSNTVTLSPSGGTATFTGMQITYTASGISSETFNLQATSGALTATNSAQLTAANNVPPSVSSITLSGSPAANASSVSYSVSFDKVASNISTDDFTLTATGTASGNIASVSAASGSSVTVTVDTISGEGSLRLDLKSGTNIVDSNGNGNGTNGHTPAFTSGSAHVLDVVAPTPTFTTTQSSPFNVESFDVQLSFGEDVAGFALSRLALTNASATFLTNLGGGNYRVRIKPTTDGEVIVGLPANVVQDVAGNTNTAATDLSLTFDGTAPTLAASQPADDSTSFGHDDDLVFTFSEAIVAGTSGANTITVFDASDDSTVANIAADNAAVTVIGSTATIELPGNLDPTTEYYLQVGANAFTDASGNTYAGISDKTTLNFTVANSAPVAVNDATSTDEDTVVNVAVLGNDTDSDSSLNLASVMIGTAPASGSTSINTGTGVISYTPNADFEGSDSFTYTVEDVWGGESNVATVTITVNPVNDAPVAANDVVATDEDNLVSINVAANDTDVDTGDNPDVSTLAIATAPANGTAVVNNGLIDYTPDADYAGSDSFTYTIEDSNGTVSNAATVTVSVIGVNDVPVAVADPASVDEDDSVEVDVLANDSDIDGSLDVTTVAIVNDGAHGTAVVSATTGVITYTPDADFNGSDSFTYQVDDNLGGTSNEATVTVTVNSINDAPVAANDTVTALLEDTPHNINVLGNDNDIDSALNVASVEVVSAPTNGATSVNTGTGMVTYTPSENYFGGDSFSYRVMDDLGEWSNTATVTLTIDSVNDLPAAGDDSAVTDEDSSVLISLLDNDSDVDGTVDITTVTVTSAASNGSVDNHGDGTVTYTPSADFNGVDSFGYTVLDDEGGESVMANVSITVNAVNDAPTISGSAPTSAQVGSTYGFTANGADADTGDTLTYSIINLPLWASFNSSTGRLAGTPLAVDAGTYSGIEISVSDGTSRDSLPTFSIEVINPDANEAPSIGGAPVASITVGQLYRFAPTVADADGDALSYSTSGAPDWLVLDANTGVLSGIAGDAHVGRYDNIVISVSDGRESVQLAPFSVNVTAAMDSDGDGVSDYQEGLDDTDAGDIEDYLDLTPPMLTPPPAISTNATAMFSPIGLRQLLGLEQSASDDELNNALQAMVSDRIDAECCAVSVRNMTNGVLYLAPGRHTVEWWAEDRAGNSVQQSQQVDVAPLVSMSPDQTVAEGSITRFRVFLNGPAPEYPISVPYVVDSSSTVGADDYTLVGDRVSFAEGELEATVEVLIAPDSETEADETLIVALDYRAGEPADSLYNFNPGAKSQHRITVTESNVPANISAQLMQDGERRSVVARDGGLLQLSASVFDPEGETYQLSWSGIAELESQFADANESLSISPELLPVGAYRAMLSVTDSAGHMSHTQVRFAVVESLPALSAESDQDGDGDNDASEGYADTDGDGVPDYLDAHTVGHVTSTSTEHNDRFLLECTVGLSCSPGIGAGVDGASVLIEMGDLPSDEGYTNVGGYFDFAVGGLVHVGDQAQVVIPLRESIPADAEYRKWQNDVWFSFIEDANNALHSSAGNEGYCPPPGSDQWQSGLIEGYWCVQLTLEDGGPNDADGVANSMILDPGGVTKRASDSGEGEGDEGDEGEPEVLPPPSIDNDGDSGGGGGGATGPWVLLLLALGVIARQRRRLDRQ